MRPVVGFDLDLTLVDSADGIVATFVAASRKVGVEVDPQTVRELIGIPLEHTCAALLPSEVAGDAVRHYRDLYPTLGVPATTLLPGASDAVAAVRSHGGRAVVVSAKLKRAVEA